MNQIGEMPIKTHTVPTATFYKLADASNRRYLEVINDTASDAQVAYTNTAPSAVDSATNGMKTLVAGENHIWDGKTYVPSCAVYVYQTTGGDLLIKVSEGF